MLEVPPELWIAVFKHIRSPADLARISLVSQTFRQLAREILHGIVVWETPLQLHSNLCFWKTHAHILWAPVKVVVGVQLHDWHSSADVMDVDGQTSTIQPPAPWFQHTEAADNENNSTTKISFALYQIMIDQFALYTSLTSLVLIRARLPIAFLKVLQTLPQLRRLHLESCRFMEKRSEGEYINQTETEFHARNDYSNLSITHLTLKKFQPIPSYAVTHLIGAQKLRSLCFDASIPLWRFLKPHLGTASLESTSLILPKLQRIEFTLPCVQSSSQANPSEVIVRITPDLMNLISLCPHLQDLILHGHFPTNTPFPISNVAVPLLRSYCGPLAAAIARPLHKLTLVGDGGITGEKVSVIRLKEITEGLDRLALACGRSLRELKLYVPEWDEEIIHAVCQLFPMLQSCHISYGNGRPSEDFIFGLGARHLAVMPHLRGIHIYSTKDLTATDLCDMEDPTIFTEADHRAVDVKSVHNLSIQASDISPSADYKSSTPLIPLIRAWAVYTMDLREVRFLKETVLRRASAEDQWVSRPWQDFKPQEGGEELFYANSRPTTPFQEY